MSESEGIKEMYSVNKFSKVLSFQKAVKRNTVCFSDSIIEVQFSSVQSLSRVRLGLGIPLDVGTRATWKSKTSPPPGKHSQTPFPFL